MANLQASSNKENKSPHIFSVRRNFSFDQVIGSLKGEKKFHLTGTGTWMVRDVDILSISKASDNVYTIGGKGRYYDTPNNPIEEFDIYFEGVIDSDNPWNEFTFYY